MKRFMLGNVGTLSNSSIYKKQKKITFSHLTCTQQNKRSDGLAFSDCLNYADQY